MTHNKEVIKRYFLQLGAPLINWFDRKRPFFMATFVSLQRQNQNTVILLTSCMPPISHALPMLQGSTVIVVNDDHTPASSIRSIFGRFAYCYMLENSLGNWRSARIAQLVRSLTANQEVLGSIPGLVEGWTLSDLLSPHHPWTGMLNRWFSRSANILSGDFLKNNPHICR